MSILTDGVDWLKGKREDHLSESVSYDHSGEVITIPATRGSTGYEVVDESGMASEARAVDFIVSADDLVFSTVVILPELGDKITVGTDIFEVMGLGAGGHYRSSDPFGKMLRIHTKHVDTV